VTRVVVVGDALLDRDVLGRVERVCPDAPVPVVDVESVHERPGGAALAALMLADAGAEVVLAAGIGADEAGRRMRRLLDGRVTVHDVLRPATTPAKTRVRVGGQSLLRLDDAGRLLEAAPTEPATDVPVVGSGLVDAAGFDDLLLGADAVLVADYGGPVARHPSVRAALARQVTRVPVVWDPHPRGEPSVPGVAVVTPNRAEAAAVAGAGDPGEVAERLRRLWSATAVTLTDGARGAVTAAAGAAPVRAAAPFVPGRVDACGAGDRFAGAMALAVAAGADAEEAARAAVRDVSAWLAAGGVSAVCRGLSQPAVDRPDPGSAEAVVSAARARGATVVATGGCFDVLHAGHLASLEAARALGDCLVVLLNSDASVRRLKGPGRPVHSAADRARLLEALSCVDAVAVFEDDDPTDTLGRLRPDVWVKAGDYAGAELPEAVTVEAAGGRVVLVPYLDGHSTTSILSGLGG
jgi:rfaE bifunctional protein nucleotidyltransferase chain/domain/rfaE bifunctional protein kinase chain/domain